MGKALKQYQKKITICCVNWFSCGHLSRLFGGLTEKAADRQNIAIIVIDNTSGQDKKLPELAKAYPIKIIRNDPGNLRGSYGHAAGLNLAMDEIFTPYAVVVDPDVFMFKKRWDTFLIDLLDRENAVAAGTAYPPWQLGKYHHFPNPVFCFFKTEAFLKISPDWTPFRRGRIRSASDFLSRNMLRFGTFINRRRYENSATIRKYGQKLEKIFGVCSRDTGWINAEKATQRGIKSVCFTAAVWEEENLHRSFETLARQFELYLYKSEPILAHKYGTASRIWSTARGSDESLWRRCIGQGQALFPVEPA